MNSNDKSPVIAYPDGYMFKFLSDPTLSRITVHGTPEDNELFLIFCGISSPEGFYAAVYSLDHNYFNIVFSEITEESETNGFLKMKGITDEAKLIAMLKRFDDAFSKVTYGLKVGSIKQEDIPPFLLLSDDGRVSINTALVHESCEFFEPKPVVSENTRRN